MRGGEQGFILLEVNFENITIELHVLYVFNMRVKFNRMLFTIQPINLFVMHNFRTQKLEI